MLTLGFVEYDQRGYPIRDVEHQRILNEHWPLVDNKGGPHARGIPDQPQPFNVRVRVVWEHDGEEWIDGTSRRWTQAAVFVAFGDPRHSTAGVGQAGRRAAPNDVGRPPATRELPHATTGGRHSDTGRRVPRCYSPTSCAQRPTGHARLAVPEMSGGMWVHGGHG